MHAVKTYYELLELDAGTATARRHQAGFRREIAKYHPDKVQHLGSEFQEIAAVKAAELTQAYKTLSDQTLRAEYDEQLRSGGHAAAARPAARRRRRRRPPLRRRPTAAPRRGAERAAPGAAAGAAARRSSAGSRRRVAT